MTRADFYDWMIAHQCTIEPLPENTNGNVIKIKSQHCNFYIYYNTPIDERPVKCYSVCNICHQLHIPVPSECEGFEPITKAIKDKHYPNH